MTVVAGAAAAFATIIGFVRWNEPRFVCTRLGSCESNMHNIALCVLAHYQNAGSFPIRTVQNSNLQPEDRLGLYVPLSPYFDYADLNNEVDQARSWHGGFNRTLAGTKIGILSCPNSAGTAPTAPQPTTSIGIAGLGTDAPLLPTTDPRAGVFGYDRKTTVADIKDGTANTMMLAESGRLSGSWLQGGPATVRGLDPKSALHWSRAAVWRAA